MNENELEEETRVCYRHTSEPLIDYPGYSDYKPLEKRKALKRQNSKGINAKRRESAKQEAVRRNLKSRKADRKEREPGMLLHWLKWGFILFLSALLFLIGACVLLPTLITGLTAACGVVSGILVFAYGLFNIFSDNITALAMSGIGMLMEAVSAFLIFLTIIVFSKGVPAIWDIAVRTAKNTYPLKGK